MSLPGLTPSGANRRAARGLREPFRDEYILGFKPLASNQGPVWILLLFLFSLGDLDF